MAPSTAPARRFLLALLPVLSACADHDDLPLQPRGEDPPPVGRLVVTNATAGGTFDVDGYELIVSDAASGVPQHRLAMPLNDSVILPQVRAGAVTVELADVALNCSVSQGTRRTVTVPQAGSARVVFAALCAPAPDPLAALPAHILFLRQTEPGSSHIVVLDTGTGAERRLTSVPDAYDAPAVSPDGRRIAFARAGELYVMGIDGSGMAPLAAAGTSPAWSPDGRQLVFRDLQTGGLSIIDAAGDGLVRLSTPAPAEQLCAGCRAYEDFDPTWSPDGGVIAFTRWEDLEFSVLWTMHADGSGAARLGRRQEYGSGYRTWASWGAVWSPDGSRLAFAGPNDDITGVSIFVMNRDGGNATEIRHAEGTYVERVGAWSSDGNWITFATFPLGRADGIRRDLWLHRISDGREIRLTADGLSRSPTLIPPLR